MTTGKEKKIACGSFVTWWNDVDKKQMYGTVQSIDDVYFEADVDLSVFELPQPDADLSLLAGDSPLYKEASIIANDGKTYGIKLEDLEEQDANTI